MGAMIGSSKRKRVDNVLRHNDKLEQLLYRTQAGFNFDADLRAVEPDLLISMTIGECQMTHNIDEWKSYYE